MSSTEPTHLKVLSLTLSPDSKVPLNSPLDLSLQFEAVESLKDVKWVVNYIVDITSKRHIIQLFTSPQPESYDSGSQTTLSLHIPKINEFDDVPEKLLRNMGLVQIEMLRGEEVLFKLSCVTMVSKEKDGIYRQILNPVE